MEPEDIDEFAHRMKAVLTVVRGYANLLQEGDMNEEQALYIEKVLKGVGRLTELINKLETQAGLRPWED